jgi:hypothetical protein
MTLPLTPEILAANYEFLRVTPPFRRYKLPPSSEIIFRVVRDPAKRGHYRRDRYNRPEIVVSSRVIGHTHNLTEVMAHEMGHAIEDLVLGVYPKCEHTTWFRRNFTPRVCKFHGFDPKLFY